jgi:PEP-CTERM motif-containing protein
MKIKFLISALAAIWLSASVVSNVAHAVVVYNFQTTGGSLLGQMVFAAPPSTSTTGWTSSNSADLQSLFLDDATFGLGAGNVLDLFSTYLTFDVASVDGTELDFALGIQDSTPGGAAGGVSDFIQLSFGTSPNVDIVESFANAAFIVGNWTVQRTETETSESVPEPSTLALLAFGMIGFGLRRLRK